jgi:hypothetical protein
MTSGATAANCVALVQLYARHPELLMEREQIAGWPGLDNDHPNAEARAARSSEA